MHPKRGRPLPLEVQLEVVYAYLDALALRVESGGKVVSVPVLAVVGVLADRQKVLLLDLGWGESYEAWKGCLDGFVARGLKAAEERDQHHALLVACEPIRTSSSISASREHPA